MNSIGRSLAITPWVYLGKVGSGFAAGGANQVGPGTNGAITDGLTRNRYGIFAGVKDRRLTGGVEYAQRKDESETGANTVALPRVVIDSTGRLIDGFVVARPLEWMDASKKSALGVVARYDRFTPNTSPTSANYAGTTPSYSFTVLGTLVRPESAHHARPRLAGAVTVELPAGHRHQRPTHPQAIDRIPPLAGDLLVPPRGLADRVYRIAITVAAVTIPALLLTLGISVFIAGWPALRQFGFSFITSSDWDPVAGRFGAAPAIFGTLVTSAIALIIATPLALGVALFITEIAPSWVRQPLAFLVDLLAAIPSVVYGLWGVFVLLPLLREHVMPFLRDTLHLGATPLFSGPAYGPSMLAAGLILAIMVLPYISAVSREVLLVVPRSQREAALALGATRWEMISGAVIPYAKSGIIGGIVLGLGRALGETMAVTMLIGNQHRDLGVAVRAGQHDGVADRERVQRGVGRPAPVGADGRRLRPVRHHADRERHRALAGLAGLARRVGAGHMSEIAREVPAFRRRVVNATMLGVLWIAALVATLPLLFIIFHLLRSGLSAVNVDFFIHTPKPVGDAGGGMANAIAGNAAAHRAWRRRSGCRSASARASISPSTAAESSRPSSGFSPDVLNGLPSVVIGIFAWEILVTAGPPLLGDGRGRWRWRR